MKSSKSASRVCSELGAVVMLALLSSSILHQISLERHIDLFESISRRMASPAAPEPLTIGLIMKDAHTFDPGLSLQMKMSQMLRSLFKYSSKRDLRLIILTDPQSVNVINKLLSRLIARSARVEVELMFFDVDQLYNSVDKFVRQVNHLFFSNDEKAKKYKADFYMLPPYLSKLLPFDRLVLLDVDLSFRTDLSTLFSHFSHFLDTNLIGIGPDLSPYYMHTLRHYRALHPNSSVGAPGRQQGFNMGVLLLDLDGMRRSAVYTRLIENHDNLVLRLAQKYLFKSHLRAQCFFTLMGLEYPQLFYNLPCNLNYQLDRHMDTYPFLDVFDKYHNCSGIPLIYHGNGGATIPEEN